MGTMEEIGPFMIDNGVLVKCHSNAEGEIEIPECVGAIKDFAFDDADNITSITIPKGCTRILNNAFRGLRNLEHISVDPLNPVYADYGKNCIVDKVNSVLICGCKNTVIPERIYEIGEGAFAERNGLKEIRIPDSVVEIGNDAFMMCNDLRDVSFGRGVKKIGEGCFAYCVKLDRVVLLGRQTLSIKREAFYYCQSLKVAVIGDGVREIPKACFMDCTALEEVSLGKDVSVIEENAFSRCKKLRWVGLSSDLVALKNRAFYGCKELKEIPDCKHIMLEYGSLYDTGWWDKQEEGLVYVNDNILYGVKGKLPENSRIVLKEGLTICDYAFNGQLGLVSLTIPERTKHIGKNIVAGCQNLKEYIIECTEDSPCKFKKGTFPDIEVPDDMESYAGKKNVTAYKAFAKGIEPEGFDENDKQYAGEGEENDYSERTSYLHIGDAYPDSRYRNYDIYEVLVDVEKAEKNSTKILCNKMKIMRKLEEREVVEIFNKQLKEYGVK